MSYSEKPEYPLVVHIHILAVTVFLVCIANNVSLLQNDAVNKTSSFKEKEIETHLALLKGEGSITEKVTTSTNKTLKPVLETSTLTSKIELAIEGEGTIHFNSTQLSTSTTHINHKEIVKGSSSIPTYEVRRIIPRKGVNFSEMPDYSPVVHVIQSSIAPHVPLALPSNQSSTTTSKQKPQFTMIVNDKESDDSESFIESSTTGKDFVFPIVLTILIFPVLLIIIKIIYKRGTEFTERQQYHRMYLIDGMYNSR